MLQTPVHDMIAPAPADLAEVRDLYLRGLCLQAYERAKVIGPLHRWRGAEARVLAGRLAMNLGAPRQGSWHHVHAFREDPADPEAGYYYARVLLERRGPLRAWGFLQ